MNMKHAQTKSIVVDGFYMDLASRLLLGDSSLLSQLILRLHANSHKIKPFVLCTASKSNVFTVSLPCVCVWQRLPCHSSVCWSVTLVVFHQPSKCQNIYNDIQFMHYKYGTKKEKKNGWQKPREKCIETRKYMEAKKEQNSNNNKKKFINRRLTMSASD